MVRSLSNSRYYSTTIRIVFPTTHEANNYLLRVKMTRPALLSWIEEVEPECVNIETKSKPFDRENQGYLISMFDIPWILP